MRKKKKKNIVLQGLKVMAVITIVKSVMTVGEAILHLKSVQWSDK